MEVTQGHTASKWYSQAQNPLVPVSNIVPPISNSTICSLVLGGWTGQSGDLLAEEKLRLPERRRVPEDTGHKS